jgi:hypothetical protein
MSDPVGRLHKIRNIGAEKARASKKQKKITLFYLKFSILLY